MTTWDTTVDLVIVGSGGGGMVAALAADDVGSSALVLEKQERIGGSTCMSGGIAWVPNNPVMEAGGVPDSYEDAMAHFEAVVGDVGPCSSFERRHAFLTAGPEMISFLQGRGVRFVYCPGYSDYYSDAKGGHDNGRGIEPVPFDGNVLGEWLPKLQPGLAKSLGLAVMTNEARSLSHYNRSLRAFAVSARVVIRTYVARLRRQDLLTNGASLIAQLLQVAIERGIPIWTEAPLEELIVEDGRVAGVAVTDAAVARGGPLRPEGPDPAALLERSGGAPRALGRPEPDGSQSLQRPHHAGLHGGRDRAADAAHRRRRPQRAHHADHQAGHRGGRRRRDDRQRQHQGSHPVGARHPGGAADPGQRAGAQRQHNGAPAAPLLLGVAAAGAPSVRCLAGPLDLLAR